MSQTRFLAAFLLAGLVACTPEDQSPFELDPTKPVEKPIGSSGGTVSTPAGISVDIPDGAITTTTNVSVQPSSETGLGTGVNGDIVSGSAYDVQPKGLSLAMPAKVEVSLPAPSSGGSRSLIAAGNGGVLQNSIAFAESSDPLSNLGYFIYVDGGSGKYEVTPKINLDIARRVLSGWINMLGTVAVGYSSPLTLQPSSQYTPTGGTISSGNYEIRCGILESAACISGLSGVSGASIGIFTDASVIDRYPKIGAVITSAHGILNIDAQNGLVSGSAVIKGVVQAVVGGTVTSKDVTIEVVSGQGGSVGSPGDVPFQTSGNQISFQTTKGWESFSYSATPTHLEFSLSETTIPLTDEDGEEREYPISLVIRLQKTN